MTFFVDTCPQGEQSGPREYRPARPEDITEEMVKLAAKALSACRPSESWDRDMADARYILINLFSETESE